MAVEGKKTLERKFNEQKKSIKKKNTYERNEMNEEKLRTKKFKTKKQLQRSTHTDNLMNVPPHFYYKPLFIE